jgi:hypothetical protein
VNKKAGLPFWQPGFPVEGGTQGFPPHPYGWFGFVSKAVSAKRKTNGKNDSAPDIPLIWSDLFNSKG